VLVCVALCGGVVLVCGVGVCGVDMWCSVVLVSVVCGVGEWYCVVLVSGVVWCW